MRTSILSLTVVLLGLVALGGSSCPGKSDSNCGSHLDAVSCAGHADCVWQTSGSVAAGGMCVAGTPVVGGSCALAANACTTLTADQATCEASGLCTFTAGSGSTNNACALTAMPGAPTPCQNLSATDCGSAKNAGVCLWTPAQ